MPLFPIQVSVAGETVYSRAFEVFAGETDDLREPLGEVAGVLRAAVGRQFESEGKSEGGIPWAPLSQAYAEWKAERYPGRPLLVRTGDMRSAFLADPEGPILDLSPSRLVWGLSEMSEEGERASRHQTGAGNLPARKIIQLSGQTRRQIDRQFVEWLSARRRSIFAAAKLAA